MKDELSFPSFTHDSIAGYCNDKPLWAQYRNDKKSKYIGTKQLWQELSKTKQALDIAKNAMKSAGTHNSINCIARGEDPSKDDVGTTINHALNEITALEQKEK